MGSEAIVNDGPAIYFYITYWSLLYNGSSCTCPLSCLLWKLS